MNDWYVNYNGDAIRTSQSKLPKYIDEGSRVWDAQREISKLSDRLIQLDVRVEELEKARFKRRTGIKKAER